MKKILLTLSLAFSGSAFSMDAVIPEVETTVIQNPTPESIKALIDSSIYLDWENTTDIELSLSGGAHRRHVKTYFNSVLTESMLAGNTRHPIGSIAIKEIYNSFDPSTLTGYAVSVKNRDNGAASGDNYYWMEGFLPNIATSTRSLNLFGNGNRTCTGCHTQANSGAADRGGDFVIIRPTIARP